VLTHRVRIERDFLGDREVPAEAYYGIQTLRGAENFPVTGLRIDAELIRALALVKQAAALANQETGALDERRGGAIVAAAAEVAGGALADQFITDPIQGGGGISIHMNVNEVIANRALEILGEARGRYDLLSPNTHVNMSQSTNDVLATGIHLAALVRLDALLPELEGLHGAFAAKAREFDGLVKVARTHLQDAVPIRLGQELGAWAAVVARDLVRIRTAREGLLEINLGATAVGTGLNADPAYAASLRRHVRDLSAYPLRAAADLVDATQNTDVYTTVSAALRVCMVDLSKIANDIRLMASGPRAGFGELRLPATQPGSSIMPGKVNPAHAELINQVAFQVIGNDLAITLASEAGQLELNVMEPVLVFNLLQSLTIMTNALRVFRERLVVGMEADADRMRRQVEGSTGLAAALNPHLGYETVARLAQEAIETGAPLRELVLRDGLLTEAQLAQVLDPLAMTGPSRPRPAASDSGTNPAGPRPGPRRERE